MKEKIIEICSHMQDTIVGLRKAVLESSAKDGPKAAEFIELILRDSSWDLFAVMSHQKGLCSELTLDLVSTYLEIIDYRASLKLLTV